MADSTMEVNETNGNSDMKATRETEKKQQEQSKYTPGVAPIKAEYIVQIHPPPEEKIEAAANGGNTSDGKKSRKRGMNKTRRKEMHEAYKEVSAKAVRLCNSAYKSVPCRFGDKCFGEHDISVFLAKKPADLGPVCPVFEARGQCPYSYACRFGNAHLDAEGKQITKEVAVPYEQTVNVASVLMDLRKRKYDFSLAKKALAAMKEGKIGSMEKEPVKLDMNEIKHKRYLAPLTTVGNLPFRRLCVDLGAEVTCGEMAIATALLSGSASEFSLLKRHPSEKIFGVQLAGGFPDTMSMAAQLIADKYEVDFVDINMGCPIDLVNEKGAGCALAGKEKKLFEVISTMKSVMKGIPLTVKLRTGLKEGVLTADNTIRFMSKECKPDLITFHPRSKEQRYSRAANWDFVAPCVEATGGVPFFVCGDVFSYEEYYNRLENYPIEGIMLGRGALIKPWIFTEIAERRNWDITSSERLELVNKFVNYGLDHWGSDDIGVEKTRRFLLESLSFTCRYIPVGLLERLPQCINDRPPVYRGRDEMETLLSSPKATDWVKISEMFLGKVPDGFLFIPKHKANAY